MALIGRVPRTGKPSGWTHRNDFEQRLKSGEVSRVKRVDGEFGSDRGCRDQKVDRPAPPCFTSSAEDGGVHTSVCASCRCVERDRFEGRLGSLEAILATSPLGWVVCRVRPGGEFRERDRGHSDLRRQCVLGELFECDDDGGVDEAMRVPSLRHAA